MIFKNHHQLYNKNGKSAGSFKKKFDDRQKCPMPGCHETAIGSHSISQTWFNTIKNLNNKILTISLLTPFPTNDIDLLYEKSVKESSVFYGFCALHDGSLFKTIDNTNLSLNDIRSSVHIVSLLGWRAVEYEIYRSGLQVAIQQQHSKNKIICHDQYFSSMNHCKDCYMDLLFNKINNIYYEVWVTNKLGFLFAAQKGLLSITTIPILNDKIAICVSAPRSFKNDVINYRKQFFSSLHRDCVFRYNHNLYYSYDKWLRTPRIIQSDIVTFMLDGTKLLTVKDNIIYSKVCDK